MNWFQFILDNSDKDWDYEYLSGNPCEVTEYANKSFEFLK